MTHTFNGIKSAKLAGVSYPTMLDAIHNSDVVATYSGGEYHVTVGSLAKFASDRSRKFNPESSIKRRLDQSDVYGKGQAEHTFKAHFPTAPWSEFAAKFGGHPERARSRFRRSEASTTWFAAKV